MTRRTARIELAEMSESQASLQALTDFLCTANEHYYRSHPDAVDPLALHLPQTSPEQAEEAWHDAPSSIAQGHATHFEYLCMRVGYLRARAILKTARLTITKCQPGEPVTFRLEDDEGRALGKEYGA